MFRSVGMRQCFAFILHICLFFFFFVVVLLFFLIVGGAFILFLFEIRNCGVVVDVQRETY